MIKFHPVYFTLFILVLLAEVYIGVFVHDAFIRPYIGDLLVAILIYCFIRSFITLSVVPLALAVLTFCYVIEGLQYCNLLAYLGLEHSKAAQIILGSSFSWVDMLCYTVGIGIVILFEFVHQLTKAK